VAPASPPAFSLATPGKKVGFDARGRVTPIGAARVGIGYWLLEGKTKCVREPDGRREVKKKCVAVA